MPGQRREWEGLHEGSERQLAGPIQQQDKKDTQRLSCPAAQLPPRPAPLPRKDPFLQVCWHWGQSCAPAACWGCLAPMPSLLPHPCIPLGASWCPSQAPLFLLSHVFTLLFCVIYKTHTAHEFVFLILVRSFGIQFVRKSGCHRRLYCMIKSLQE